MLVHKSNLADTMHTVVVLTLHFLAVLSFLIHWIPTVMTKSITKADLECILCCGVRYLMSADRQSIIDEDDDRMRIDFEQLKRACYLVCTDSNPTS
jgi:hypothetical protein